MIGQVDRPSKSSKIVTIDDLPKLRERFRDRKIVLCHGVFDLVHTGHLLHFEEAKALGDVLVVTVTADPYITKKRTVMITQDQRARQVAALEIVDHVAIIHEPTALSAIEALKPDVYVKGPEYAELTLDKNRSIYHEMRALERYGGRIHFTSGETFSSTKLAHFLLASPDAAQRSPLLRNDQVLFRDMSSLGFKLGQLKAFLAKAAPLRVGVIGEAIVDEWVNVTVANLSTQSHCLAGVEVGRVQQIGGAGVIALHLANFVGEIHCFTNGLTGALPPNIRVTNLAPAPIVETRFVDRETGRPVFKTRKLSLSNVACDGIPPFDQFDLVLIADFGHGLLNPAVVNERIAKRKRAFVGVMAQVNSNNYGYNLPTKYVGADYYALNRTEAELCIRERGLPLDELVTRASRVLECDAVSVTDGSAGVMVALNGERFQIPSLSAIVVDTIGCGDAFFALSSTAACAGLPANVVALAGSIGAAAMAQRHCNESPVTEQEFLTIGKIVI